MDLLAVEHLTAAEKLLWKADETEPGPLQDSYARRAQAHVALANGITVREAANTAWRASRA